MHEGYTGQPQGNEAPNIEWVPVESVKHGNIYIKACLNNPGTREPWQGDWTEELTVATVWDGSEGANPDWLHEQRANARLLAAAPLMLYALRCASEGKGDWRGLIDEAIEQATNGSIESVE